MSFMENLKINKKRLDDDGESTRSSCNASCLDPLGFGTWIYNKYRVRKYNKNLKYGAKAIEGLKIKRNEMEAKIEMSQKKVDKLIIDIKTAIAKKQKISCIKLLKEKRNIENDIESFRKIVNTYNDVMTKTVNTLRQFEFNESMKTYADGISKISINGFFKEFDSTIQKLDEHELDMSELTENISKIHQHDTFGEVNIDDAVEEEYESLLREINEEEELQDQRTFQNIVSLNSQKNVTKIPNTKKKHGENATLLVTG